MGNGQLMESFMPSEIARLVLGYLKETGCMKSWESFLSESPHLCEYQILYKKGKEYPTNVGGKSLLKILQHYYIADSKDLQVEMQNAAQQTDQDTFSRSQSIMITSESPSVNANKILQTSMNVSDVNFQQRNCTSVNDEREQTLSNQCSQHKNICSSVSHTKEGMLLHSHRISPLSSTTTVTPMDISETTCLGIVPTSASACQAIKINTESMHKQLPSSHCQQCNCVTTSSFHPSQTTGVTTANSSQTVLVTQCHQQCPQIGVTMYSNHNCQFSTTVTSQSSMPMDICVDKNETVSCSGKKVPISSLHNRTRTTATCLNTTQNMNTILKDVTSIANIEHIGRINRMNSEKRNNCENSSPTTINFLSLESHSSNHVNRTTSINSTAGISRTVEYSPHTFLSQQRLLPSLNTPMKELSDLEDYFCSPKRKSLLPRRRLLSSFSPVQMCASGIRMTEDVEFPSEEATDYSMLMEEFFKCTPLLEKIAENINKVVCTEQNQMAPTAKQITDSDLSFPAQVSHNHEAMIKDIVTRTESDPAFEDLLSSLCEKVDSSKDGFENATIQNEQLESNRESSTVEQNKVLEQTETAHCSVPAIRKENGIIENTVKEKTIQADKIITSSNVVSASAITVQENILKNDIESSKSKSPTDTAEKVTESCMNSSMSGNNNEKLLPNQIENAGSTNQNCVVVNEKLTTQNTSSVALVTELNGNVIQTKTAIPESRVVLTTSNTLVNNNIPVLISDTRQPMTITTPNLQFLTLSPRHLYGFETPASFASKKVPNRVQSIRCKPLAPSDPAVVTRNSFVDGGSHKPVNRIPKDMLRRVPPKRIKPNILKTSVVQGQVAESCNDNSASLSSQNNSVHSLSSTVNITGTPKHNANSLVATPNSKTRSKARLAEKTSPQLKSLVTSVQTIAGNAFLNKTHKRSLDFGTIVNTANQTTNVNHKMSSRVTNQLEIVSNNVDGVTMENKNQLTFAVDNLLDGFANNGEIVIYLESPEVVTSEGTITIPLNNESETIPAYLTYTLPETNGGLVANANIILTSSNTQDTVAQNQIVPSQQTSNNDSEIAETLVKLASSIPDSDSTNNKNVDSTNNIPAAATITTNKKQKRPSRKHNLRPKRRKLEDVLRQGMDIDKFLSRLNYEN